MRRVLVAAALILLAGGGQAQPSPAGHFALARCSALPIETQMHGCAVVGQRLYAFGGENRDGYSDRVYSCEILDSGSLGTWKEERPLPDRRHYISGAVEVVNNRIYVAGGTTAPAPDTPENQVRNNLDVLWTSVQPDGSLAPWKVTTSFPGPPRANLATCSTDKRLYIVGGNSSREVSNAVLMAEFAPDGSLGTWSSAATLPMPLWYQGSAILDNRLYVWGGLSTLKAKPVNGRAFSAEVRPDGTLAPWREETPMPEPVYSAAFCGFNDYLICVGGRVAGAASTDKIWFSRLENGRVGEWRSLSTDLQSRVYHSLGLDRSRGRLYITGGKYRAPSVTKGGTLLAGAQAFQLGESSRESRAEVAAAPAATADSIRQAVSAGRSVLLYFHSPEVPAVRRFEQSTLASPDFARLTGAYQMQSVDSSRDRSFCYDYSVFQVPALVIVGPGGQVRRSGRIQNLDDVKAFLEDAVSADGSSSAP